MLVGLPLSEQKLHTRGEQREREKRGYGYPDLRIGASTSMRFKLFILKQGGRSALYAAYHYQCFLTRGAKGIFSRELK